ncbi:MAG TPA: carbohydrate porin [Verrucomicrobiae bacterium]
MSAKTTFSVAAGLCLPLAVVAQPSTNVVGNGRKVIAAEVEQRETGFEGDHLTGDWGGTRTKLLDRGVHLQAGYIGEVIGNASGGLKRGAVYEGLFEAAVKLDTRKAGWWEGGTFQISTLFPHGKGFSQEYVGDLLTASNIEAYESWRLYDLWYEHAFGEKISVRIGQFSADEEFALTESGSSFMNAAFGWPAFISANTLNTGPAYYVAAPGIRFNFELTDQFFIRAAAFDGDSFDSEEGDPRVNAHGTRFDVGADQGVFGITEFGFRWDEGVRSDLLPGEYKIGMWAHSGDFVSNFEDENRDPYVVSGRRPREHSKNFGVYVALEQMLWREKEEQGVYVFARAGVSPEDRNFFEVVADGGLTWRGMIPSRDEDIFGIGGVYARISRDIRRAEKLDAATNGTVYPAFSNHETVLEGFYQIQLAKWWTLQPDVQWIFNPGGNESVPDAVVVALRTSLVF